MNLRGGDTAREISKRETVSILEPYLEDQANLVSILITLKAKELPRATHIRTHLLSPANRTLVTADPKFQHVVFFIGHRRYVKDGHWIRDESFLIGKR